MTVTASLIQDTWNTPAIAQVVSTDPAANAVLCQVLGIPAVGQSMVLRVASALTGQIDLQYAVVGGETIKTVAAAFTNMANADPTLIAHNIGAQYSPDTNIFGITNRADCLAYVTPLNHPECWHVDPPSSIYPRNGALDANSMSLARNPPFCPPNGSNIWQLGFNSSRLTSPGQITVSYGLVHCNVENNDPNTGLRGRLMLATPDNSNAGLPQNRITIVRGVAIGDSEPQEHGSLSLDAVILGGHRLRLDPDGVVRWS